MTRPTIVFGLLGSAALTGCIHVKVEKKPSARTPQNGRDLISQMHDVYAGKWYQTLTFVQKTTIKKPTGEEVATWYRQPGGWQRRHLHGRFALRGAGQQAHSISTTMSP